MRYNTVFHRLNILSFQMQANYPISKAFAVAIVTTLVLCLPALAQGSAQPAPEPLTLTDEQGEYPLGRHMDILEDPGGALTIEDVAAPEFAARFTPNTQDVPNFGYTSSTFWLRLRLRNETVSTSLWLLEVNFPNLNYVDLFIPSEGNGFLVKQSGALRPFSTREIPYYHVVFRLPLAQQDEQTFYIRVESGSSMTLAFTLWSPEAFAVSINADMLRVGLFYGALLIMLGYHLFALYFLKEANYLFFVLFLASAILFWATYEGVADQFLWPGISEYKLPLLAGSMALFFMAALKFSNAFLEQKTRAPRLYLLFNLFIGLWGLVIVIVPFVSYGFVALITAYLIPATLALTVWGGFDSWRKGCPQARFYLFSWLGFLAAVLILELVRSDILPSTPLTESSYRLGLIWLVMLWSLALADRIKLLKKETEDANQRLLQSERKLSQILEGLPIGVAVYEQDRKPAYINRRAVTILANPEKGIHPDVRAGRTIEDAMKYFAFRVSGSDQAYPLERMPVWQAFEGQSVSVDDIEADLVDRRVPLEIWANPMFGEAGKTEMVVVAFQDISRRKQMSAELEKYRDQLEQLVEKRTTQLRDANELLHAENLERQRLEDMLRFRLEWLVAVNQAYQSVNQPSDLPQVYNNLTGIILKTFGATDVLLAEIDRGANTLEVLAHARQPATGVTVVGARFPVPPVVRLNQLFRRGQPIIFPRKDLADLEGPVGDHFREAESPIIMVAPLLDQGSASQLLGLEFLEVERRFSVDEFMLLERIAFDIAQIRNKPRLMEQAREIIAAEERNRLARDLHDSVTQVLFSASLVAEVLPQIWQRDPDQAQASLKELRRLTHGALAEMRTLLLELRPSAVLKTPLSELLAQLTEAVVTHFGLPFRLIIGQTPALPENVHTGFYRVAQESLNNVVKHAQASEVIVSLTMTPPVSDDAGDWSGEVRLVVRDNGRGFTPGGPGAQHMGLAIMNERAIAMNAALSVESQPGQGTTVTLTWQNGRLRAPGGKEHRTVKSTGR